MKYIFAISVLLTGHIITNIADDSGEKEDEWTEHGIRYHPNTSLDKEWSAKDMSPEDCEKVKAMVYQPKNISKEIQQKWKKASKGIIKESKFHAKSSVQKILNTHEINDKNITDLVKMSRQQFKDLSNKAVDVQHTMIKATIKIFQVLNVTLNMLRGSLESVVNSTHTPVESFVRKMKQFSRKSHSEIYCLVGSGETKTAKRKTREADGEILKLSRFIDKWLTNAFKVLSQSANNVASKGGETIVNEAEKYISKIKSIETENTLLISHIKSVVEKIKNFAQTTKDACTEIAEDNLDSIEFQIEKNILLIKRLALDETELNKAIIHSRTNEIEEMEKEVRSVYEKLKITNIENRKNHEKEVNEMIAQAIAKSEAAMEIKYGIK